MSAILMVMAAVAFVILVKYLLFPSDDEKIARCLRCGKKMKFPTEYTRPSTGAEIVCRECFDRMMGEYDDVKQKETNMATILVPLGRNMDNR